MSIPVRPGAAERCDQADAHPLVAAVRRYSHDILAPLAVQHDDAGVPTHVIASLAELGLLNHVAPRRYGGAQLDRAADRRIHEHLSYGCVNTWLIWAQHASVVGRITLSLGTDRVIGPWAERVLRGEILAGVGISDVRRYPREDLRAVPARDGWTFDGTVSWISGWGLNKVLLLAGVDAAAERVVTALVPVSERTVATALPLRAVGGSHTKRVHVNEVTVPAQAVVAVEQLNRWHAADRDETSDARPPVFGVTARVLDELSDAPAAVDVVASWTPRVAAIRETAYQLADEAKLSGRSGHRVDDRLATRATAHEALAMLSQALLLTRAGRGLASRDTAQLHCRSAMFLSVQGQTAAVRSRQLARIAAAAGNASDG